MAEPIKSSSCVDEALISIAVAAVTEDPPYSSSARCLKEKQETHVDPTLQRLGPNIATLKPSDSAFTIPTWHLVPDSPAPAFIENIKWLQNAFVLQDTLDSNAVASPGDLTQDPLPTHLTFGGLGYLPVAHSSLNADRIRSSVFDALAAGRWPKINEGNLTPTLFRSFFEALLETVFSIRQRLDGLSHGNHWQLAVLCMPRANAYVVGVVPSGPGSSADKLFSAAGESDNSLTNMVSRVPLGEGLARRRVLNRVCRSVKVNHPGLAYPTWQTTQRHHHPSEPVRFGFGFLEVEEPFLPLFHSPSEVSTRLLPEDFIVPLPSRFAVVTERSPKFLTACFTAAPGASGKCNHHFDAEGASSQWSTESPLPMCDCFTGSIRIDNLQWGLAFGAATPLRDLVIRAAPLTSPGRSWPQEEESRRNDSDRSSEVSMDVAAYLQLELPPDLDFRPVTEYVRIPLAFNEQKQSTGEAHLRWSAMEFFAANGKRMQDSFNPAYQRVSLVLRGRNAKVSLQATMELTPPMYRTCLDEKLLAQAMDEFVEHAILFSAQRSSHIPGGAAAASAMRSTKIAIFTTAINSVKAFARAEAARQQASLPDHRSPVSAAISVFRNPRVVDTICAYMPLYRLALASGVSVVWRQTILRGLHTYPAIISWLNSRKMVSRPNPDSDTLVPLSQGEKAGDLLNALRIQALCMKDLSFDVRHMPGTQIAPAPPAPGVGPGYCAPVSPWHAYTEQIEYFHSPSGVLSLFLLWQNSIFRPQEREFHYPAPGDIPLHVAWLSKRWNNNSYRHAASALYRFPSFLKEFTLKLFGPTFTLMVLELVGSQVLHIDYSALADGLLQTWPRIGFDTYKNSVPSVLHLLSKIACPHWSLNFPQLAIPFSYRDDEGVYHRCASPLLLAFAQHSNHLSKRLFQMTSKEVDNVFFRTPYRPQGEVRDLLCALACSGVPAGTVAQSPATGGLTSTSADIDFAFAQLLCHSHLEHHHLSSNALRLLVLQKNVDTSQKGEARNGDVLVTPRLVHAMIRDREASLGMVLLLIKLREWSYDDLTFHPQKKHQSSSETKEEVVRVATSTTEDPPTGPMSILEYCILHKRLRIVPHLLHYFVAFPEWPSKREWNQEKVSDLEATLTVDNILTKEARTSVAARVCPFEGKQVPLSSMLPHLKHLEAVLQKLVDQDKAVKAAPANQQQADAAAPVVATAPATAPSPRGVGARQSLHHIRYLLKLAGTASNDSPGLTAGTPSS